MVICLKYCCYLGRIYLLDPDLASWIAVPPRNPLIWTYLIQGGALTIDFILLSDVLFMIH